MLLPTAVIFALLAGQVRAAETPDPGGPRWNTPHMANPVLPGYFADPSVLQYAGKVYFYATIDPWGGRTLGCWESSDFRNWTYRVLNWPTKEACTSPTSKTDSMVWAPSVVRVPGGRFYMYLSVGSEIWVGTAADPLGPWTDANGGRPLVTRDFDRTYHMIDAEAFVDDDGSVYLYWGSGWNWVNGRCYAAKLGPDLVSFDGPVRVVTPAGGHYFEAPFMAKRKGLYFLMYSGGKTISDTYCVHYAAGPTPFGPFVEGPNTPILATDRARDVISPGHHAIFHFGGRDYIAYHRHRLPFVEGTAYRQVCIDPIEFTGDGRIGTVLPSHSGPALVQGRSAGNLAFAEAGATASASSRLDGMHSAARAIDDNYATRWAQAPGDPGPWLELDLGAPRRIQRSAIRFEYAWKPYFVRVECSVDGQAWRTLADHRGDSGVSGSPVVIAAPVTARFLRLDFDPERTGDAASVFEWEVY